MQCAEPFVMTGGRAFSCGKCLPCLRNRRAVWAHRIMLEAQLHSVNSFITLTYADENLPVVGNTTLATLMPRDLQLWLKRFRKRIGLEVRYFAVGEYGDENWRPHYHAAVFGYPACLGLRGLRSLQIGCECLVCSVVRETWGLGHISVGTLTERSAAYVAGYVTGKVLMKKEDVLCGRVPQFARMSLRPGIGFGYVSRVSKTLPSTLIDVPGALRYGGMMQRPLGRYLQRSLRQSIGRDSNAPISVQVAQQAKLLQLRKAARTDEENPSFRARLVEEGVGRVASLEARMVINRQRRGR